MIRRTTCLRCETPLVPCKGWLVCPKHDAELLQAEIRRARIVLGIPPDGPMLRDKGVPKTEGKNP